MFTENQVITNLPENMPGNDIEVAEWHLESLKLREYAAAMIIACLGDMKTATNDLTIISRLKKAMSDRRQFYVRPLNDQVKAINDTYKVMMQPVEEAEKILKDKMLEFNREQERIRREQEEINRKRQEAAEAEMRLKGELTEPVNLVDVAPETPRRVVTDMGTAGMRDNWTWEITDFALLPDDYKLPNTSALNALAKSTKGTRNVTGVRIFNQPIIATRPR